MYFSKSKLAPYPNDDGCPFYTDDADDEKEFFTSRHIFATRIDNNCEDFNRLGMAIALRASCIQEGGKHLHKVTADAPRGGIPALVDALEQPKGKAFLQAAKILNCGLTKKPSENSSKKAIDAYCDFLAEADTNGYDDGLAKAAQFSARLYLFCMAQKEAIALQAHKTKWAKRMKGKQPKAVTVWQKDPENEKKFKAALLASFRDKVKGNK